MEASFDTSNLSEVDVEASLDEASDSSEADVDASLDTSDSSEADMEASFDEASDSSEADMEASVDEASNSSEVDMEASFEISDDCDVAYGSNSKHKVDVYWPSDADMKPEAGWTAVVILPGKGSDRKSWKGFCTKYVVLTGRLCVAADYRQGDKYRNGDVFAFAKWFHQEAGKWDVDKTKIVLGGASQGGLTLNNVIWDKEMGKTLLKSPPKLKAVMLLSGTWDGHNRKAQNAKYWPESTFIMTSDNDNTVPHKYSKNLEKALVKKKKPVKFVQIPDGGHSIWYNKKEEWYAEILTYLEEIVPTGVAYS